MHCLEVIIEKNERAAGREAAHAFNDGNTKLHLQIIDNTEKLIDLTDAFVDGYITGKREG
jgi:hypothetical protein